MPITNIKLIAMAAIAAMIALTISFLIIQNKSLKKELVETQKHLAVAQTANESMRLSIEKQNSAIDKLIKDADERQQKHAAELDKAKKDAARAKAEAAAVLLIEKPQNVSACDAAAALIKKEMFNVK